MWLPRQAVEIFHLLFLRAFGGRVDKTLFALKGGCNLRFFMKSIRYSEDMDLDIHTLAVTTLANNVNRLLEDRQFVQALRAQQIEIARISAPKQTAATQRWKVALRLVGPGNEVPTKIEFSRRGTEAQAVVEPVDAEVIRTYRLYPIIVPHYPAGAALEQKVLALAQRSEVQARDVFDLDLLLNGGAQATPLPPTVHSRLARAIDNAMSVGYDEFAGQVLAYLEPAYQEHYRSRQAWDELQQRVVDFLEGARR